jgi:hypothetical protein
MITREQIHELAQFEDSSACAVSFYYQPATPRNKAHKEDAILIKDLAREALHRLESRTNHKCASAREDLERIVQLSQSLRSNGTHAKAVFACAAQAFWREYDLPPQLGGTELRINRHFYLKPVAQLLGAFPSLGIALVDRQRARLFDLRLGELTEREEFFHPLPRRRSDGFAGYDAGHVERHLPEVRRGETYLRQLDSRLPRYPLVAFRVDAPSGSFTKAGRTLFRRCRPLDQRGDSIADRSDFLAMAEPALQ